MNPNPKQVRAGEIAAGAIRLGRELCRGLIRAEQLDKEIETYILDHYGRPALKGYQPGFEDKEYQHTICLALDNEVVHGTPVNKVVTPEHLITIDLVVEYGGWYADTARTFTYSDDPKITSFLEKSQCLFRTALSLIKSGIRMKDFGRAVQAIATIEGLEVIDRFCGHGIGTEIHMLPQVINTYSPDADEVFEVGYSYAIEPVLSERLSPLIKLKDGWTYAANCLASHFEDTIWVGESETIRLTA